MKDWAFCSAALGSIYHTNAFGRVAHQQNSEKTRKPQAFCVLAGLSYREPPTSFSTRFSRSPIFKGPSPAYCHERAAFETRSSSHGPLDRKLIFENLSRNPWPKLSPATVESQNENCSLSTEPHEP